MQRKTLRPAIAMLELIFSIVIMGIVMLSSPLLITTATQSSTIALQQESITLSASEIGMILTYPWDENDTNQSMYAPILHTQSSQAKEDNTTHRRAGTPLSSHRSFVVDGTSSGYSASTHLGTDRNDKDDIDDFNGITSRLTLIGSDNTAMGDIIDKDVTLTTTVAYIGDTPDNVSSYIGEKKLLTFNDPFHKIVSKDTTTSNLKMITVTLTTENKNQEMNKTITLHAFSCNIGTFTLKERTFE